jgi:hypothetical protein
VIKLFICLFNEAIWLLENRIYLEIFYAILVKMTLKLVIKEKIMVGDFLIEFGDG